ncbi:MAG: DUF4093 domain-containing protein [Clostridia bacterium]|nr:DUF4093 domain-containing protein [Clostridia bacterium]
MKQKLSKAIIVEGKYDKIRLSNIFDTIIVTTEGFGIFNDKSKQKYIKKLADSCGVIILTDSDGAGFVIRNFVRNICAGGKIYNAYIPDISGKEKRKTAPSKENKLGVEGIDDDIIRKSIANLSLSEEQPRIGDISMGDLFELGIIGGDNSSFLRKELTKEIDLPEHISSKALLEIINLMFSLEELKQIIANL